MSGALLVLPVAAPLLAAGLMIAVPRARWPQRAAGAVVNALVLLLGAAFLVATLDGTPLSLNISGWPPGFAIMFAVDAFSALMLCVSAILVLAGLGYAAASGDDADPRFAPLVSLLAAGVYGAFLTADLFDLFVFVEVMLVPSYALLTMAGARPGQVAAGRIYVTVNLLASTVFLAGVALLYGVTGTVNIAELNGAALRSVPVAIAGAVVLTALAIKAAVVPLHGWLPRTYPYAPPAVTLLFSGLLTKVGVYAIMRIYAVLFDGAPQYRWAIMTAALATMVVGVLGAVGEQTMRGILSFHLVSQIGYILLGLALFTTAGIAAAIFFMIQYVLVKAALLACAGAVETAYGTGRLDRLGGLSQCAPLLAAVFMTAALSLAGLPPLSGFVGKLGLVRATFLAGQHVAVAVAIAVSLLTLMSMIKIWGGAFWGDPTAATETPAPAPRRAALTAPALVLAVPSLVLGIGAQPLLTAATAAATGLVDTATYVRAVTR